MSWRGHISDTEDANDLVVVKPKVVPFPRQKTRLEPDQIFINDLVLDASIGVYDFERSIIQPVKINIVLDIEPLAKDAGHEKNNIVCYDTICQGVKAILSEGHIDLVETLAEQIAEFCLRSRRARKVLVSVAKPDAITEADDVGIRITRTNQS
jgi:dihydroneopterin aldolase